MFKFLKLSLFKSLIIIFAFCAMTIKVSAAPLEFQSSDAFLKDFTSRLETLKKIDGLAKKKEYLTQWYKMLNSIHRKPGFDSVNVDTNTDINQLNFLFEDYYKQSFDEASCKRIYKGMMSQQPLEVDMLQSFYTNLNPATAPLEYMDDAYFIQVVRAMGCPSPEKLLGSD